MKKRARRHINWTASEEERRRTAAPILPYDQGHLNFDTRFAPYMKPGTLWIVKMKAASAPPFPQNSVPHDVPYASFSSHGSGTAVFLGNRRVTESKYDGTLVSHLRPTFLFDDGVQRMVMNLCGAMVPADDPTLGSE